MIEKRFICINCPLGCQLNVQLDAAGAVADISGFSCQRGKKYAQQEAVAPLRTLTSLMPGAGREQRLSVKSTAPLPKEKVLACAQLIRHTQAQPPVAVGQVVIKNILGCGVDIVATRRLD